MTRVGINVMITALIQTTAIKTAVSTRAETGAQVNIFPEVMIHHVIMSVTARRVAYPTQGVTNSGTRSMATMSSSMSVITVFSALLTNQPFISASQSNTWSLHQVFFNLRLPLLHFLIKIMLSSSFWDRHARKFHRNTSQYNFAVCALVSTFCALYQCSPQ